MHGDPLKRQKTLALLINSLFDSAGVLAEIEIG
jgi:hypothetical protein